MNVSSASHAEGASAGRASPDGRSPLRPAAGSSDTIRLRAVRQALAQVAPGKWTRVHDEAGAFIEAQGEMGELFRLARFDEATVDEIDFVVDAPERDRFLLRLLDQAFATIRALKGQPEQAPAPVLKNYAAECALKCREPAFKVFLEQRHGLDAPLTDDRAAQKVRSLLGVSSRGELNGGGRAVESWKALRADFMAWKKAGR